MAATQTSKHEWFKNAGKSMGAITKSMLSDMMPVTMNTASSGREALRDARKFAAEFNSLARSQHGALGRTAPMKKAKATFEEALNDLKSGNFGINKANDDLFDDWDHDLADNFDMGNWEEEESEISSEEITIKSSEAVAKSVIRAGSAQLAGMQEMTRSIIGSSLKASEASTEQTINAIMYSGNMMNRNLIAINNSLGIINKNLVSMMQFQNETIAPVQRQLSEYLEESSIMMKDLGKMLENYEKHRDGVWKDRSDKFDATSGFKPKDYLKYVKKNFSNNWIVSALSLMTGMDMGDSMPLVGKGIKAGMSMIIPNAIKEAMSEFDKHMGTYMQEILYKIGDMEKSSDTLASFIGEVFGVKRPTINKIRMGNYSKEVMPWNGLAQQALTEVIPEYLSAMESGIDALVKHFGATKSDQRKYDYAEGQFKTMSQILKEYTDEYSLKTQMELMEPMTKMVNYMKKNGMDMASQQKLQDQITNIINARLNGGSVKDSRNQLSSALSGFSSTQFKDVMVGIEEAMINTARSLSELNDSIGNTPSVYRNLGLNYKNEAWKSGMKVNPFGLTLSRPGEMTPKDKIESILSANGYTDMSCANETDLKQEVAKAMAAGIEESEIESMVIRYYRKNATKNKGKAILNKLFGENRGRASRAAANKISELDAFLADAAYGTRGRTRENRTRASSGASQSGETGDVPPRSSPAQRNQAAASSGATRRAGIVAGSLQERQSRGSGGTSKYSRNAMKLSQIQGRIVSASADKVLNQTDEDAENKDIVISAALRDQMDQEPDGSLEGSIAQMNETHRTGILAILNSFQNMNRGIFGKEGFIKKFFESPQFQDTMGKIKEYFIGDEKGIFKDQWKSLKAGAKNLGGKVKNSFLNGYDVVYTNTLKYILGENYKEKDAYTKYLSKIDLKQKSLDKANKKNGVEPTVVATAEEKVGEALNKYADSIEVSAENFEEKSKEATDTLFGDSNMNPEKKKASFLEKFKKTLPKAIAAGIVGAGAVALSGGSMGILGSLFLPGSIIGGAITGFGGMLLTQTEAFKSLMFGKESDNGERQGGLITKKMGEAFKKAAPIAIGGATLGALKHVITGGNGVFSHGPLGVLTSALLPGGILGGALIGMGIGLLKNSDTIKDKLFGEKDGDGKRAGGFLSKSYNKLSEGLKKNSEVLKKGAAGAGVGVLSAVTLGSMGIIPSLFSIGGPVGMGIAGFTLGIASTTKKFNEMVFGSEELDEEGNPTGKRNKDGLLTRMRNLLMVNFVEPIGDKFEKAFTNTKDWVKEAIEFPFRKALGPIIDGMKGIKDNIVDTVTDTFSTVGNGIVDTFKSVFEKLFNPLAKIGSFLGKSAANLFSAGTKLALSPLSMGLKAIELATMGKRREGYIDFYKNYFGQLPGMLSGKWELEKETGTSGGLFHKTADIFSAIFDPDNELKMNAREGWNEQMAREGKDSLKWREVPSEQRQLREEIKLRKKDNKRWQKIDKLRAQYSKEWGGREFQLKDAEEQRIIKQFGKYGLELKDSDDIMNLVYRRNDWKKDRLNTKSDKNEIKIAKTDEEKRAVVAQIASANYLEYIRDYFADLAWQKEHPDWNTKTGRQQMKAARKLQKRAAKEGYDLNLDSMGLTEEELISTSDMSDEEWNAFRGSDEYKSGNFAGWLRNRNKNRKEREGIEILNANIEDLTDTQNAALELATGGAKSADDIKDRSKRGIRRWMDQYNVSQNESLENVKGGMTALLDKFKFWKKKEARIEKEAQEQADITSNATGGQSDEKEIEDTGVRISNTGEVTVKKKKGIFGTIFGFLGGLFSPIAAGFNWLTGKSKGGSILGGVLKTWGIGSLIIGVMNAIKPGFSEDLMAKAENIGDDIPRIVDTYIAPHLGKLVDGIGTGLSKGITWVGDNAQSLVDNIFIPAINGISNFVVDYAPDFISKSADVMISLIPSITEAFIKVVPALATSLTKGIYDATLGAFLHGKNNKKASEDDIAFTTFDPETGEVAARQDQEGNYMHYNPKTGQLEITGDRTAVMGLDGKQTRVTNTGGAHSFVNLGKTGVVSILKNGSKSLFPKMVSGVVKGAGTVAGGLAGHTASIIPGISTIAGAKAGSGAANLLTKGIGKIFSPFMSGIDASKLTQEAAANLFADTFDQAVKEGAESFTVGGIEFATKRVAQTGGKNISTYADFIMDNVARTSGTALKDTGVKAAQEGMADAITDQMLNATKNLKSDNLVLTFFKSIGNKLKNSNGFIGKFINWTSDIINKGMSKIKSLGEKGFKYIDNIAGKLGFNAAKIVPLIQLGFTAWDGITGALEAENLFHVSKADWLMRIVSSIMKMLSGLSIFGAVLDCILEVIGAVLGRDIKCEMASFIYTFFAGEEKGKKLEASQAELEIETQIYNELTQSNLSTDAYNDLKNKSVFQKAGDWVGGVISKEKREEHEKQKAAIAAAEQAAKQQTGSTSSSSTSSTVKATNANVGNGITVNIINADGSYNWNLGKGPGLGYGSGFSQKDSRWAKMRIGTMPNGAAATMANGGCGPTALAMAANDLYAYGPVTPGQVGAFAARNGYISSGGANAGLFTAGAAQMGLGSTPLGSDKQIAAGIASGNPVILSGRSSGGSDPYTRAGHIVVAEGMDGSGNVRIKDPADGRTKKYGLRNILKNTETGFALSRGGVGYGRAVMGALGAYSDGGTKYVTWDNYKAMLAGDSNIRPIGGAYDASDMRRAFYSLDANELIALSHILIGKDASFPTDTVAMNTGVTRDMIINTLGEMVQNHSYSKKEWTGAAYLPVSGRFWKAKQAESLNDSTVNNARDAMMMLSLIYKENNGLLPSSSNTSIVKAMLFDENFSPVFKRWWIGGWLPKDDISHVERWCECLSNISKSGLSYTEKPVPDGLYISTVTSRLRALAMTANGSESQKLRRVKLANDVEAKFVNRIAAEKGGKSTSNNNSSSGSTLSLNPENLYDEIVSELSTRNLTEFSPGNVNGYVWYDPNDSRWADSVYNGRKFSQMVSESGNTHNPVDEILGIASVLSTFTGKPFTPKLVMDKLLPYMIARNQSGTKLPVNIDHQNYMRFNLDRLFSNDATYRNNFFGFDFMKDNQGRSIKSEFVHNAGASMDDLKLNLQNKIPLWMYAPTYDGSIFGGSREKKYGWANPAMAILQNYIPDKDMVQFWLSSIGSPFYDTMENLTRYKDWNFRKGGLRLKYSDNGVPEFKSTSGQMSVLSSSMEGPVVDDSGETGPFALLSKLLNYIASGIENVFSSFLTGGSIGDALKGSVNSISNLFGGGNIFDIGSTSGGTGYSGANYATNNAANEQAMWKYLRKKGLSENHAAAIMGNIKAESDYSPINLQNSYESRLGSDLEYTKKVDNGTYSRNDFAGKGHSHGGYGLAQWTYYARKQKLYDLARSRGTSIGDLNTQLDYLYSELNDGGYLKGLQKYPNVREATAYIMSEYEKPANTNPNKRIENALGILDKYQGSSYYGRGPLGYGPDFSSFAQDANTLAQTMGGLMYSKLTGGSWRDGMSAVGNMDAGFSSIFGDSSSFSSGDFGSYSGGQVPLPITLSSAKPDQQKVVQKMASVVNKLKYTLGGNQNPDNGYGSCASTVTWAYNKTFGNIGLVGNELAGASSLSKRADGLGNNDLFTPVWKKVFGNSIIDSGVLEPGDLLFYNDNRINKPYDPNAWPIMTHVEMFAGDNQVLNHGGPNEGDIGPKFQSFGDYKKKRLMMASRFNRFITPTASTTTSTSTTAAYNEARSKQLDRAKMHKYGGLQAYGLGYGSGPAKSRITTGFKALPSAKTNIRQDYAYYGTGPNVSTSATLREALRVGSTDQKLDAILGVISEWYDDSKKNPGLGNVNITNSTTNTMISANGKTETKHTAVKPTEPSNDRLRSLYDSIARINT